MFCDMETLLSSDQWPSITTLGPHVAEQLACICDVRDSEGDKYYRLNRDKVTLLMALLVPHGASCCCCTARG